MFVVHQGPDWGASATQIVSPGGQYETHPDDLYLYFSYNLNEKAVYNAFAVIADKEGIDVILAAGE